MEQLPANCIGVIKHGKFQSNRQQIGLLELVDASNPGTYLSIFDPEKSYATQLQTIELGFRLDVVERLRSMPCVLPKLRHLTLVVSVSTSVSAKRRQNIFDFSWMIKACPSLQKLTLKLKHNGMEWIKLHPQFPEYSHQNLKVVELIGFIGHPIHVVFSLYMFKRASALEKMIVETLLDDYEGYGCFRTPNEYKKRNMRGLYEGRIEGAKKMLKKAVPERVELIFL